MKTFLMALLFALSLTGTAWGFQNEPDGFRGLKWGTAYEDVATEFTDGGAATVLSIYRRAGDKRSIGEAELSDLAYAFYAGSFHSVMMKSSGYMNKRALIQTFQTQFGAGQQPNRYIDRYVWLGPISRIVLDCNSRDDCTAIIASTVSTAKERADRKAGAEKAKQDF